MTRILFRCDASLLIGSGHVMRCRTLARELQRQGAEVCFLCRRQPGDLISLLKQEFVVFSLPEQSLASCDGLEGRDLYDAWLGCSQEHDAAECLRVLADSGINRPSWIVADHYGLDARWEMQLLAGLADGEGPPKLLAIDDLADRPHQADLLLDQNFFGDATHKRYRALVPPHCCQLVGPYYALLGPEYAHLHPLVPSREKLRRVLVFFGGVDSDNLTGRALEALLDPALADLEVDVVLGLQCPHRQAVKRLAAQSANITLHSPLPSLAGLIARADLAIGAGGTTTWERACLRLPSLVLAIAANQLPFIKALEKAGYLQLLGEGPSVTAEHIRSVLLRKIIEPLPGEVNVPLTDGWGAPRLVMAMLGPCGEINLRPAISTDQGLLLHWAKDAQIRLNSSSTEPMELTDHKHWFQKGLQNPNELFLIATAVNGCSIGQIRFDLQPPCSQADVKEALVDLTLDRCVDGDGLTAELVRLGLQVMEKRWGLTTHSMSEVLPSNVNRNACFARFGFKAESDVDSVIPLPVRDSSSLAMPPGRVTILSDGGSWLNRTLPSLIYALWQRGHAVRWIHTPAALCPGEVCLLLSCGRLLNNEQLSLHPHNLVVHESALPHGQGWSPMTWQILEGSSSIPITLFEAVSDVDAGPIYLQQHIQLQGHELVEEWRSLQARATLELCLNWFDRYSEVVATARSQCGEASHYPRRRPADSKLCVDSSLSDQFNLLRVVDNQSYPAYFHWHGRRYTLTLQSD